MLATQLSAAGSSCQRYLPMDEGCRRVAWLEPPWGLVQPQQMSACGAPRHFAAPRNFVAIGNSGHRSVGRIGDGGEETVQQCGQRIFDLMLKTASGQPTKSESFDFGGAEFAPWVLGATM